MSIDREDDFPSLCWLVLAVGLVSLLTALVILAFVPGKAEPADIVTVPAVTEAKADEGTVIELPAEPAPVAPYEAASVVTYDQPALPNPPFLLAPDDTARLEPQPQPPTYEQEVAYAAYCFDTFMAEHGPGSLWIGRGYEVVTKCWAAGFLWEFAAACLYAESDWGRQATGLIWGNAYTLDGWIEWVNNNVPGNKMDVDTYVNAFHGIENMEEYRTNFGNVVNWALWWRP